MSMIFFFLNTNKPPSVSVTSASVCSSTAAPPGPRRGRTVHLAARQRSSRSGCFLAQHPDPAGCWRWKRPQLAPTAPQTRPPGSYSAEGTGSAPGTCSEGGRWRCCPTCPRWWWGLGEHTGLRCCGRHLKSETEQKVEMCALFREWRRKWKGQNKTLKWISEKWVLKHGV